MNINSHYLKLSGKVEVPDSLELGHAYKVTVDGEVDSVTDHNNHDGSFDRSYKLLPLALEVLDDHGETISRKDVRSKSQLVPSRFWSIWHKQVDETRDDKEVYNDCMDWVVRHADEVYDREKEEKGRS